MSKKLNSNFLCKIGRTLYGYAGMCRFLGQLRADQLISKALRSSRGDVFRWKSQKLGVYVSLYWK